LRVLYLTYNGLTEPLGRRQVLPYVLGLAARGWRFTIVSFEKTETADDPAREQVARLLEEAHAEWIPRRYHKRPTMAATSFDAAHGIATALRYRRDVGLIHARSTVPALMAAAAARVLRIPWIFDVRGLLAEEYADGGHWSRQSLLFRLTDRTEGRLLRQAKGLVFLTERIRDEFARRPGWPERPTAVIPCAVDLAAFSAPDESRLRVRAALDLGLGPVLTYAGSLGSWYRLREMLTRSRRGDRGCLHPDARRGACARRASSPPRAHPRLRGAARQSCYSARPRPGVTATASSPTKYGEYLASGLAVVTNPWTGDAARLEGDPAWILVKDFSREAYAAAARDLRRQLEDPGRLRQSARALAARCFSMGEALDRYDGLYRRVLEGS
jgi:glycosyltransferase involved in cell wall biosynthesis